MLGLGLHTLGGISAGGSYSANSLTLGAAAGSNAITFSNTGARLLLSESHPSSYLYYDTGNNTVTCAADFGTGTNLYTTVIRGGSGAGAHSINLHDSAGLSLDAGGSSNIVRMYAQSVVREIGGSGSSNLGEVSCTATINSTAVGNVGASGPDDLQTYQLPANSLTVAGRGIRIRAWGTTAANGNAKTVRLVFGSATLVTKMLATGVAGTWEIEATILRTGASAQDYYAKAYNNNATGLGTADIATVFVQASFGTATQTETAAIDIKVQSTVSTANDDIVSQGLIVEYI